MITHRPGQREGDTRADACDSGDRSAKLRQGFIVVRGGVVLRQGSGVGRPLKGEVRWADICFHTCVRM